MEKYYIAVISLYLHQEGVLEEGIRSLIKSNIAVQGLGLQYLAELGRSVNDIDLEPHLIKITYDINNNLIILFRERDHNKVEKELKKKLVRMDGLKLFDDLGKSLSYVDNPEIHNHANKQVDDSLLKRFANYDN